MLDTNKSAVLFERGSVVIPGGVNSPVRAFKAVGGTPRFMACAKGCRITDVDGNCYIDFMGSWGPMLLGHANETIVAAVQAAAQKGLSYGAPTEAEVVMAERLCALVPSLDMVRMVSSGTEAVMSALRAARGFTGRDNIVKFEGCYHGHADGMLVAAGSGLLTQGVPDSAGVPQDYAKHTITLPYNDSEAVRALFKKQGDSIAAVIVEPVAANMGVVLPQNGFLETLRLVTEQYGALLVFDEVITGFRLGLSGAQGYYGVTPDLSTFGKIIGGGMPVGAYGGRADIMHKIAPLGPVYQAGTLSGNPVAMAAGLATLDLLSENGLYEQLAQKGEQWAAGLKAAAQKHGIDVQTPHVGSLVGIYFNSRPVYDYKSVKQSDANRYKYFFHALLERGVYIAPSAFEAMFISIAHNDNDIIAALCAADESFSQL